MRSQSSRRGNVLVQSVFGVTAVFAFASLAVDFGRVNVIRYELHAAATAGARAGAVQLGSGLLASQLAARGAAEANVAEGTPIAVDLNEDVEFGRWNDASRTFTLLTGDDRVAADAVRVTVRRTAARGNAVPLSLAGVVGRADFDVLSTAIARVGGGFYPFVGLEGVDLSGNGNTDSYDSSEGPYASNRTRRRGTVASNAAIEVSGNSIVRGDALSGSGGGGVHFAGKGEVTGTVGVVAGRLYFPASIVPPDAAPLGDLKVNKGTFYLAPGDYVCSSLDVSSNAVIQCTGPVRLFCTGSVSLTGGFVRTYNDRPVNFELNVTTPANISFTGQADFHGRVYAPLSDFRQAGTGNLYGTVIARTLTFTGSWQGGAHADESIVGASHRSIISVR